MDIENKYEYFKELEQINIENSFHLAKECSKDLHNKLNAPRARMMIIHILDNWLKVTEDAKEIWIDLIESAGFYPYLKKIDANLKDTASLIRKEYFSSNTLQNIYFHDEQKHILNLFNRAKNLIVSAPTSFGKSLLIEEMVASKKFRNIVVIQPTLALLDETRKKLQKYLSDYKIIIRTSQQPSDKRNLFLLTSERVLEYKNLPKIDLLVLDEFYKLSNKRDDERSDHLNNAFNLLINTHQCRFYLLGPNIDGISNGFAEKYNAKFYKTNYSLVHTNVIDIYAKYKDKFGNRGQKKQYKIQKLYELLYNLKDEQTIIYCQSPNSVYNLAIGFQEYLQTHDPVHQDSDFPLIEWINENVSSDWSLAKCLKYNIGMHNGALQKHITTSIIKYFNNKQLNSLFCTSTIIEGVNTSAKNVIFFDSKKGRQHDIDYFDYSNIKGRSGRLMEHFIGNIYNFNPVPQKKQIIIDIPFFEQNPVSDEVLINIPENDVKNPHSKQYSFIKSLDSELKKVLKNNGVSIYGQLKILKSLEHDIELYGKQIINWTYPSYEQLKYVLQLAWDNLLKPSEARWPMTRARLAVTTYSYSIDKSINKMLADTFDYYRGLKKYDGVADYVVMEYAIHDIFQMHRHWFQYKIPKWLSVINNLQVFLCQQLAVNPGNYIPFANMIENDFIRENLSVLSEYGIPKSAIDKMQLLIPRDINEDQVIPYIKKYKLYDKVSLLQYEKEKVLENI
jgi:Helicase conserved C-terminal domain/DEAD/DEAH box helicase